MSMEQPSENEKRNEQDRSLLDVPALDEELYGKFSELYFDDYEYLSGSPQFRNEQKKLFLAGEIRNPELDYPRLVAFDFVGREAAMIALKEESIRHENRAVSQAYQWRINEMLAQLRMLRATYDKDDRQFARYSEYVYGRPSETVFEYDKAQYHRVRDKALASGDSERISAANELEGLLGDMSRRLQRSNFSEAFPNAAGIDIEKVSAKEALALFIEAVKELGLDEWSVVLDESGERTDFSVSQEYKTAYIPGDEVLSQRKSILTKEKVKALIEHELATHALRRASGEGSKLRLLGLGLDRYLRGEEGLATYKQQQVEGAVDFSGFPGHFSVAIAKGVDRTNKKPRDFREIFEIVKRYHLMSMTRIEDDRPKKAEQQAWNSCVRRFRGSTGNSPGAVLTKDIVYREGNVGIYQLINRKSVEQHRFMVGKYDPTNERHLWVLDQLGLFGADPVDLSK